MKLCHVTGHKGTLSLIGLYNIWGAPPP